MKIGFFDSGIGGTTILEAVQKILPNAEYKYIADSENCPYGEKSDEELQNIVSKNVETLKNWGARIIVIACNTATTRCISYLRAKYPELYFVGTEPAIKLAVESPTKNILLMATPGTVESERVKILLDKYQKPGQTVYLLPCPGLADVIEANYDSDWSPIDKHLDCLFKDLEFDAENIDAVVLGCTHYTLIKELIQKHFKSARLIDGSDGVARKVYDLVLELSKTEKSTII